MSSATRSLPMPATCWSSAIPEAIAPLARLADLPDAVAQRGRQRGAPVEVDQTGPVDHAGVEQARDQVNQTGAADALGRRLGARMDVDAVRVDPDAVDRPRRTPHPVTNLRALEGGPGRRRAGPEPLPRAEEHFAV